MSATEPVPAPDGAVRDLPPSAKLVYKVLEYNDQLTQRQLATETRLPDRTVRHALGRLDDAGLVAKRSSVTDARKRVYSLQQPSV